METITEAIEFFIGIVVIILIAGAILLFASGYMASSNISNYKEAFAQNIKIYLINNTLYFSNKGSSIGGTIFNLNLSFSNGTYKQYMIHFPTLKTGTTTFSLPFKNLTNFASIQIHNENGGYVSSKNIQNIKVFTISNMYSSSYVYMNGQEMNPIIENFSTYYYNISSPIIHLLLYSPYYYYNATLYNNNSFNIPTNIYTYYIEPMLINGTNDTNNYIPIINRTNAGKNIIQLNNYYKIIPGNEIINFSYSGNQTKLKYCYNDNCNNKEYSNYSGIFSIDNFSQLQTSPTIIPIYQNSLATIYLATEQYNLNVTLPKITELISVPGDLVLKSTTFKNLTYSFQVNSSGITNWIRNGNYTFIYTTFNDQIVKGKVDINGSRTYILGAKTFSLTFDANSKTNDNLNAPFSIDSHSFTTPISLKVLNNTEYYYNFSQNFNQSNTTYVFESQNVCGKTINKPYYNYFVNQTTTPCTIVATYYPYEVLKLIGENGTIEAINSSGNNVLSSNGTKEFIYGTNLTLKEIPNTGYMFYEYKNTTANGYTGADKTPTITMTGPITEIGYFIPDETIRYTETNGTIVSNYPQYCPEANSTNPTITCDVPRGLKMNLTYTPNLGYNFINYTGTYNSTNKTISFITNKSITETANARMKIYYLPFSLNNTQNIATASPFQQKINFDANQYSQYESNNLGNIRFYTANNQTIDSWCEENCSNNSTNTIFYIKLPNGIPATSTQDYKIEFLNTSINYNGTTAGEAPELSGAWNTSSFGKYDNGQDVFISYAQADGTVPSSYNNSGEPTTPSLKAPSSFPFIADTMLNPLNSVEDDLSYYPNSSYTNKTVYVVGSLRGSGTNQYFLYIWNGANWYDGNSFSTLTTYGNYIYSSVEYINSTTWIGYINHNKDNSSTISPSYGFSTIPDGTIANGGGNQYYYPSAYWINIRSYPPNGVMPTITWGNVSS